MQFASERKKDGDLLLTLEMHMPPPGDAELLRALERLQGEPAKADSEAPAEAE